MTASDSNIGSCSAYIKWWRRTILFVSITLSLSAAYAQDESQNKDASGGKKPSLEFKLRVLTPTVCLGVPLKLRLEVTNVGQETVKLNRAYFWNNYSEYPTAPEKANKDAEFFFTHTWPRSTSEDIFFLAPGKTYVAHRYWALDEGVTKSGPGNYTLELGTHGTGITGQFELRDCERKEIKEQ